MTLCKWLCGKPDDTALRAALADAEDAWGSYTAQVQKTATIRQALAAIKKPMTPAGLDGICKSVASQIADIYAAAGRGVKARDAAVFAVVYRAIQLATAGEAHWNVGGIAPAAYGDDK